MANGMLASVNTTAVALGESFRSLHLFGSAGSLALDGSLLSADAVPLHVGSPGEPEQEVPPLERALASGAEIPTRRAAGAIKALGLMLEDWRAAFDGGDAPDVPTLVDGHRVQEVVDAARRSSDGAGWVDLEVRDAIAAGGRT
jgi:predicted dehydrogenase